MNKDILAVLFIYLSLTVFAFGSDCSSKMLNELIEVRTYELAQKALERASPEKPFPGFKTDNDAKIVLLNQFANQSSLLFGPIHSVALSRISNLSEKSFIKEAIKLDEPIPSVYKDQIVDELWDELLAYFATGKAREGRVTAFGDYSRYWNGIDEFFTKNPNYVPDDIHIQKVLKFWNRKYGTSMDVESFMQTRSLLSSIDDNPEMKKRMYTVLSDSVEIMLPDVLSRKNKVDLVQRFKDYKKLKAKGLDTLLKKYTESPNTKKEGETIEAERVPDQQKIIPIDSKISLARQIEDHLSESVNLLYGPIHLLAIDRIRSFSNPKYVESLVKNDLLISDSVREKATVELWDELLAFFHTGLATRKPLTSKNKARIVHFGDYRREASGIDEFWISGERVPSVDHIIKSVNFFNNKAPNQWSGEDFLKARAMLVKIEKNPELKKAAFKVLGDSFEAMLAQSYKKQGAMGFLKKMESKEEVQKRIASTQNQLLINAQEGNKSAENKVKVKRPKAWDKYMSYEQVMDIINQKDAVKVEVGAADSPLCRDCIQVDLNTSSFEMANKNRLRIGTKREKEMSDEDYLYLWARLTATDDYQELLKPWAVVTEKGVIASANRLPLANNSIDQVISKNFPWLQARMSSSTSLKNYYRSFLKEYYRVINDEGRVTLLFDGEGIPEKVMAWHISEARKLGFEVDLVRDIEFYGIVLSKSK